MAEVLRNSLTVEQQTLLREAEMSRDRKRTPCERQLMAEVAYLHKMCARLRALLALNGVELVTDTAVGPRDQVL